MSDSPKDHDFDWVTARLECCEANEFVCLRDLVERDCAKRLKALPANAPVEIRFVAVKDGQEEFYVEIIPVPGVAGRRRSVSFDLRNESICVRASGDADEFPMTLTVQLDDKGECRFAINGKGEYLRWQVARRALQAIFFAPRQLRH